MYKIEYTKQAVKDIELIKAAKLDKTVKNLIEVIRNNQFEKMIYLYKIYFNTQLKNKAARLE